MSKALKALSIFAVLCAVASVVFVVVFGIQEDRQIEEFLNSLGAVEQAQSGAKTTDETTDKVSPLLKHAKAFALRINPPPPPPPKKPKAPKRQVAKETKPERPKPKAPVRAKFKLLATCRYEQQSERSLALLDMPVKGIKWYRQGDDVGHLTIQEVKDGSVICSDGQELFVPVSKRKTKSLLKSDVEALYKPEATLSTPLEVDEAVIGTEKAATPQAIPTATGVGPGLDSKPGGISTAKPKVDSTKRRRVRRLPQRKSRQQPPPEPTPEERKKTITESIATIKELMNQPDISGDEESEKEEIIWQELLDSLEEEKKEIEESIE